MIEALLEQFDQFADEKKTEYIELKHPELAAHMTFIQLTLRRMTTDMEKGKQLEWNNLSKSQEHASSTG